MDVQSLLVPTNAPIRDAKLLPTQPPAQMLGRNRELAAMQRLLKAGTTVFLAGPAGAGKTSLAAVLASAMIASKRSILWLHVLEDDLETLVARVGRSLGMDTYHGTGTAATLKAALTKENPILVLDGLLDVDAAREFVKTCVNGTPVILAHEETAGGPWTPLELGPLSAEDSRALFSLYSGLNDSRFAQDVEAVSKFLDGNPLTIQLAGRLIATENMSAAELLTSLPSSMGHDGHQLVLPVVFKHLSAPLQGLLMVLASTFTGSASLELLSDMSGIPAPQMLPVLRQLVGRGMVRESMSNSANSQPTFTVHEAVQRYTLAWLKNYQRLTPLETRALQSIVAYVDRHADGLEGNQERLAAELPNILGAAAFATDRGNNDALNHLVDALTNKTGDLVAKRGFWPEVDTLKKLQTLLSTAPRPAVAQPTKPSAPVTPTVVSAAAPADATKVVTPVAAADQPTTPVPVIRPISAFKAPPAPTPPPSVPETPPSVTDTQTPTAPSLPSMEGMLADARAAKDSVREAAILQSMGSSYADRGDFMRAFEQYKLALAVYETTTNNEGLAATLEALSDLARVTETPKDDLEYASRGVELARKMGDKARLGRLLIALADAQQRAGDSTNAIQSYMEAVQTLRGVEDWTNTGTALSKLSEAYLTTGQYQEAAMMAEQAIVIFHKEERLGYESRAIEHAADAYAALRQWPKATDMYQRALYLARERFDHPSEAVYLGALGQIYKAQGKSEPAILHFRQALDAAYRVGNDHLQGDYLLHLGEMLIYSPQTLPQAAQLLREANEIAPENRDVQRLLHRVEKQLGGITNAGINLPPADESARHYAAGAAVR